MRFAPRLGLLFMTLALPVGAALANHVLGDDPVPPAPVEIRVGESHGRVATGEPSSVAVGPQVVGQPAATRPRVAPSRPPDPGRPPAGVVPPAPPVVADGEAEAKGKPKKRSGNHPTPGRSQPSPANGPGG